MSKIDIILLIPILWGAYKGFTKGLITEIASLLALLLGVYGTFKLSSYATPYVQKFLKISESWVSVVAFALVFVAIVLLVFLLGKILDWLVSFIALGFVNKIGGIAFGILKFVFIMSLVLTFIIPINNKFELVSEEILEESVLFEPVSKLAPFIIPIIKDSKIYEPIKKGSEEVLCSDAEEV